MIPRWYVGFCLLVLLVYGVAHYRGWALFDTGTTTRGNAAQGSSYHYTGAYLGAHK